MKTHMLIRTQDNGVYIESFGHGCGYSVPRKGEVIVHRTNDSRLGREIKKTYVVKEVSWSLYTREEEVPEITCEVIIVEIEI